MKKIFLLLLVALFLRFPLDIWKTLTPQEQVAGLKVIAKQYCEEEMCFKVKITITEEGEFVIFKLECLQKMI